MKKIYSELAKIQQELKAPKNLYNNFGKYAYRNAEGILEAVKPLLGEMALIINDEPVMIGERYYIKATVTLTNGDESVSAVAYAREDETKKGMDGCQVTGSCSSYARKYALNALLMIDDSKDSDDDALSPKNPSNVKDLPAPESENKPFKRPEEPAKAEVQQAPINPVFAYIANEKTYMAQLLGISKDEMKIRFGAFRKSLIDRKVIEDIPADKLTMEQAKALVDAIYKDFFADKKGDKK